MNGIVQQDALNRPKFQTQQRWLLVGCGVMVVGLLFVSRTLTPNDEGMGTHKQLGLPECGFVRMFGKPCPSCGMTTSWALLTRGRVFESLSTNPGGTMLGLTAVLFGPWMLISGIQGRWLFSTPPALLLIGLGTVTFVVTISHWIYRLNS